MLLGILSNKLSKITVFDGDNETDIVINTDAYVVYEKSDQGKFLNISDLTQYYRNCTIFAWRECPIMRKRCIIWRQNRSIIST